ncbi:MAG: HAD-IA family hydrolase [Pseudomonadota bacterium]
MSNLRLVIFDVDGTLVDSEALIYMSFTRAYESLGLVAPPRKAALNHVGITLDHIFPLLSPELDADTHVRLAAAYRDAYFAIRQKQGDRASSPFFPGARETLDVLKAQDWTLLAIATGKAKRGLDAMIAGHGLEGYFLSAQSADDHPSKPHPSMIHTCLLETGVEATQTVMIGDTTFDMDMGRAAGVKTIGVGWGHHPVDRLKADMIVSSFAELLPAIDHVLGPQT